MATEYKLQLVIQALDKATAPLRDVNKRIRDMTAPVRKVSNAFHALSDEAGIPRLLKSFSGVGSAVKSVGQEAMSLGLKLAGMAAAAAFGFYRLVEGAVEAGSTISRLAERTGLAVDAYTELRYSAGQADVEQEEFNDALDQFSKRLGQARANAGPLYEFLGKVAPTLRDQVLAAKDSEQALYLLSGAFQKVTDPAKRSVLVAELFGKSSKQMGIWLGQGTDAIDQQRARYRYLAGSQQHFADGADSLEKTLKDVKASWEGLKAAAAVELFPSLTRVVRAFTDVLVANRDKVVAWAQKVGAAIGKWVDEDGPKKLTEAIGHLAESIDKMVESVGGAKNALIGLGVVMSLGLILSVLSLGGALWKVGAAALPMIAATAITLWPVLANVGATIYGLGIVLAPLVAAVAPFALALVAVAAAGYAIYKNWAPLKELFSDINMLWGAVKDTFGHPLDSLKYAGGWWKDQVFGPSGARPQLAVTSPGAGGAGPARQTEATVTVKIEGAPKGTRAAIEPGATAPVDLDMGYALWSD